MVTEAQRRTMLALMDFLIAHRGQVHYPPNDVRREKVATIAHPADIHDRVLRSGGWTVDCSQISEAIHRAAGLKLPFRDGYTGSYLDNLPHYSDGRGAYIGGPVVFGPGEGHHMALVHTRDPKHGNPLLFSHGQEADPRLIFCAQEAAYQPHPVRFVSIAKL